MQVMEDYPTPRMPSSITKGQDIKPCAQAAANHSWFSRGFSGLFLSIIKHNDNISWVFPGVNESKTGSWVRQAKKPRIVSSPINSIEFFSSPFCTFCPYWSDGRLQIVNMNPLTPRLLSSLSSTAGPDTCCPCRRRPRGYRRFRYLDGAASGQVELAGSANPPSPVVVMLLAPDAS